MQPYLGHVTIFVKGLTLNLRDLFPKLIEFSRSQFKINNKANTPAAKRQLALTIAGRYHSPYIRNEQISEKGIKYVRLTPNQLGITKCNRSK